MAFLCLDKLVKRDGKSLPAPGLYCVANGYQPVGHKARLVCVGDFSINMGMDF